MQTNSLIFFSLIPYFKVTTERKREYNVKSIITLTREHYSDLKTTNERREKA